MNQPINTADQTKRHLWPNTSLGYYLISQRTGMIHGMNSHQELAYLSDAFPANNTKTLMLDVASDLGCTGQYFLQTINRIGVSLKHNYLRLWIKLDLTVDPLYTMYLAIFRHSLSVGVVFSNMVAAPTR